MSANKNVAWGKIEYQAHADADNFVQSPMTSLRQRTLSPRERLLPPESPAKKTKKRSSTKKLTRKHKQEILQKSKSVATQTDQDKINVLTPSKFDLNVEFPVGSIVGINGYDLDYGKFKVKKMHQCSTA